MLVTWSAVGGGVAVAVNVPPPLVRVTLPGGNGMCEAVIVEPAGNPARVTTAVAVALVIFPDASFTVTNVIVTFPDAVASALVMGGVSFDGSNCIVNVGFAGVVGAVLELPQAAANSESARARAARFMGLLLVYFRRISARG
jgi:hypothetical protein